MDRQDAGTADIKKMNSEDNAAPKRRPSGQHATTEIGQDSETNLRNPAERKANKLREQTARYQERKALGICRDCDEELAEDSTIFCEIHNARMREYRKKYKAKRWATAKETKEE